MNHPFHTLPFRPADILLPKNCPYETWSVIACDQFTAQPDYWLQVEAQVGRAPSALRLMLPESCLEGPNMETDIMEVNHTMSCYLREGRFQSYPNTLVYVERTLSNGQVRRGLVGMVDLEQYDEESAAPVSPLEATQLSRIPPRVAVRKLAPLELSHVLLLTNDPEKTLLEPLGTQTHAMEPLYDFTLMEQGGHIRGWALTDQQKKQVASTLSALQQQANQDGLPFLAVGDGAHALATAKECYERQKQYIPREHWSQIPARFALAELVNLHDPAVTLYPIHRGVLGVDPEELLQGLLRYYPDAQMGIQEGGQVLSYAYAGGKGAITIHSSRSSMPVGTLQKFLTHYLADHPGSRMVCLPQKELEQVAAQPQAIGFFLPPVDKETLFPAVAQEGVLPRKSFSLGLPQDKRYYLEARKIRT